MAKYPSVIITQEMIDEAKQLIPQTCLNRTITSKIDTLTGHLGEFVFAQYFYNDWRKHKVGNNRGETDFNDIEIKTSAFPFSEKLNLLVREDYAIKRKPAFYIQIIIDVNTRNANQVLPGTKAFICGFATADEIDNAPKRDFGSKLGSSGGYKCHYTSIKDLHPMNGFKEEYASQSKSNIINLLEHNRKSWNRKVESKNQWTIPVTSEEIENARKGKFEILLTPWKPVPMEWFPPLQDLKVLCLASAGGQQAPLLAAAGAGVTVFDISEKQLEQDILVANRENLSLKTIMGDMTNLSVFDNESFDLIFHPVANCFIPDILPVWKETYRVLRKNGRLLSGFANPVLYLLDEGDPNGNIEPIIKNKIPYSDIESLTPKQKKVYTKEGISFEFGHTLQDQIGGQINTGLIIDGFYEDKHHLDSNPLYDHISTFMATKAVKI